MGESLDINEYIQPELLALIPALYVVGSSLKNSKKIRDEHIPMILGGFGILFSCIYVFGMDGISAESLFTGIVQGILVAGASVYANQLYKQSTKAE